MRFSRGRGRGTAGKRAAGRVVAWEGEKEGGGRVEQGSRTKKSVGGDTH